MKWVEDHLTWAKASLAALVVLMMFGTPSRSQQSEEMASKDDDLRHVQKLFLRFHGVADLTGEYRVSADGAISVPVIGRVKVNEMNAARLEQVLMQRGRELAARETFVSVEVVEFKPIFVTGYVTAPGAAQWRPGMTVLHAVALTGGLYRPPSDARGAAASSQAPFGQMTQLRKTLDDQKWALVQLALLRAEEQGKDRVETPDELKELVGSVEAEALVREHAPILAARREGLDAKLSTFKRAEAAAKNELAGLQQQREKIEEQLRLRQSSREKLEVLFKRGLVRSERTLEETIRVSELEEKLVNIGVAISRVQATLAGLEREAVALGQARTLPLRVEIQALERKLAQNQIEVEGAVGLEGVLRKREDKNGSRTRVVIEFSVMRSANGEDHVLQAQHNTRLLPGDVVSVTRTLGSDQ